MGFNLPLLLRRVRRGGGGVPALALLDRNGDPLLDRNGDYILARE